MNEEQEHAGQHIGNRIRILNNLLYRHIQNSEVHRRVEELTGTGGYIIAFLNHNRDRAVFQKDLEEAFGITRSTASKVISRMEKNRLVLRRSVPEDARLKQLLLTPKAEELVEQMYRDANRTETILTKGIAPEELAVFCKVLEQMSSNMKVSEEDARKKNNAKKEERNIHD